MSRPTTVHVPLTLDDLVVLDSGAVLDGLPAFTAQAAPDAGPDETESAEFDALCEAAAASLQRVLDTGAAERRVVGAARVDQSRISGSPASLDQLRPADLTAVYVDEDAAVPDVRALLGEIRAGSEPADALYDSVETRLMLWHDPSELAYIVADHPR